MAQLQSTSQSQQSQTNVYPSNDQIQMWQAIMANAGGLSNYIMNNYAYPGGVNAQVAAPTDLTNEYWQQVAGNAGMPDVSGTVSQMNGIASAMNNNMAPTSFNLQPGQVNLPNTFANGTPTVSSPTIGGTAADYQYNPMQVSGPTVSASQVQAPGAINPITGLAQVQAPSLQQYQMGPAQQVQAPSLSQFQMQAAAPVSAGQTSTPQSWNDPGTAASYMSPYETNVMNVQSQQAILAQQQQALTDQASAVQAGAFGGSRDAVVQANSQIALQQQLAQIQATGLQNAYTQGQQQFNTQQQAGQQAQQFNVNTGLQAALANQQAQQQANVQNLSSYLQTQGLGAQTGLQAGIANQQAGLTVGQQNLASQLQTQGLGAQLNMQGQLANQSTGLQSAVANQQAQEFGAGQQLQASLANQSAGLQAALASAGYNMQGQLANQSAGLQSGLTAEQLGFQGASLNANLNQQAQYANQAAQMQAMGLQYQGGLQSALQTQNLGLQGQVQGAQLGLQGNQLNLSNLAQQGQLGLAGGQLGLSAYNEGLQGMTQLSQAAQSQQGYQQQIADTQYQDWLNSMQMPMQATEAWAQMAAMSPSWGQTTTSTNYGQGQTDQPTFNFGQLAGGVIAGAAQVGAAAAGAKRGGLLSISEDGTARFAKGGLSDVSDVSGFRKRLYAPLRRHHNYPSARRRPIAALDAPPPANGLGDMVAYA